MEKAHELKLDYWNSVGQQHTLPHSLSHTHTQSFFLWIPAFQETKVSWTKADSETLPKMANFTCFTIEDRQKSVIGSGFWISMNNCTCFPSTFTVQISDGLMKYYKHILRVNATDLIPLPVTQIAVWSSVIVIFLRPHREQELMVGGDLGSLDPDLCCPGTLHWLQPGAEPGWSFRSILPGLTLLWKYCTGGKAGLIEAIYDELARDWLESINGKGMNKELLQAACWRAAVVMNMVGKGPESWSSIPRCLNWSLPNEWLFYIGTHSENKGPESRTLWLGHWYFHIYLLTASLLHFSNEGSWGLGPSCAALCSTLGYKVCIAWLPWTEGSWM